MIDVDGLVIEGRIAASVVGTRGFMAPELVTGKQRPTINSDKHALAVIIYKTLLDRHPLHGVRRFLQASSAEEEDLMLYGQEPLFIEHPDDARNRPRGMFLPARSTGPYIENLFRRAFVAGLTRPEKRPMASEWETALSKTLDRLTQCVNADCPAGWFVLDDDFSLVCPKCRQRPPSQQIGPLLIPYKATPIGGTFRPEETGDARTLIVGADQKSLYYWHLRPGARENGTVEKKPLMTFQRHQDHWTLKNELGHSLEWYDSEERYVIPNGQRFPLRNGAIISVGPVPEFHLFEVRMPFP